jgi:hypothetical protein
LLLLLRLLLPFVQMTPALTLLLPLLLLLQVLLTTMIAAGVALTLLLLLLLLFSTEQTRMKNRPFVPTSTLTSPRSLSIKIPAPPYYQLATALLCCCCAGDHCLKVYT